MQHSKCVFPHSPLVLNMTQDCVSLNFLTRTASQQSYWFRWVKWETPSCGEERFRAFEHSGTLVVRSSSVLKSTSHWRLGHRWRRLVTQTPLVCFHGQREIWTRISINPPAVLCSILCQYMRRRGCCAGRNRNNTIIIISTRAFFKIFYKGYLASVERFFLIIGALSLIVSNKTSTKMQECSDLSTCISEENLCTPCKYGRVQCVRNKTRR